MQNPSPVISISIPKDMLTALDAAAKSENRSRSNMVAVMIDEYTKQGKTA